MKFRINNSKKTNSIILTALLFTSAVFAQKTDQNSFGADIYQVQAMLNSGLPANLSDNFGISVAIDGDTAIVGTQNQDIGANAVQGAAYIFVRNGSTWNLQQMLTSSDGRARDKFGAEVAVEGDTAFVARYNPTTAGFGDGKIYVFRRIGTNWSETQTVVSADIADGDAFGSAMAVDNGTLVAGAPGKGFLGATYIFTSNRGGTWTQQVKLTQQNPVLFDNFGWSDDISGYSLIVGNPGASGLGAEQGRGFAYVFTGSGTNWTQQGRIQASDRAAGDLFGFDVAISGNTAAIGASDDDSFKGAVYVFTRNGGTWVEQTKIVHPNTSTLNRFGTSVAFEGQTLAVTAPKFDAQPNPVRGTVVYSGSGGNWNQVDFLETSGASCVDINNNSIISGQATAGNSTNGEVFVHASTSSPTQSPNFNFDFDGDGKADLSVFRPNEGTWYLNRTTAGFGVANFGLASDQLAPADYDGDGKTDIAVWRDSAQSRFYILQSSNNTVRQAIFGITGDNPKVVGDWDGDGIADLAVYLAGAQSVFYYLGSNNNPNGNITFLNWGTIGDKPVRGDFDGDGKLDLAVFRPSNAVWYIRRSSDNQASFINWGLATDKIVPADYDGDTKTDLAVYRDGAWFILQSSNSQLRFESFGLAADQTVPADYSGDGKADIAVFRSGIWYVLQSADRNIVISNFGLTGDIGVPGTFTN